MRKYGKLIRHHLAGILMELSSLIKHINIIFQKSNNQKIKIDLNSLVTRKNQAICIFATLGIQHF